MRLIDADALKEVLHETMDWCDLIEVDKAIRDAPTIDAEQVVRCKDCKWWIEYSTNWGTAMFCDNDCVLGGQGIKKANDYCSCGERKDNETD